MIKRFADILRDWIGEPSGWFCGVRAWMMCDTPCPKLSDMLKDNVMHKQTFPGWKGELVVNPPTPEWAKGLPLQEVKVNDFSPDPDGIGCTVLKIGNDGGTLNKESKEMRPKLTANKKYASFVAAHKNRGGRWYWRIEHPNGHKQSSSQSYSRKSGAVRAGKRFVDNIYAYGIYFKDNDNDQQ